MSSLIPNADDSQFIDEEFLENNVYINSIEDDNNFVLNTGFDQPNSVFGQSNNEGSSFFTQTNSPNNNEFDGTLSLQPPTLDVVDNETEFFDASNSYEYEIIDDVNEGPHEQNDNQNKDSYIITNIPTVVYRGVEGKFTDDAGQILQFYDADNQPVTYFEELPDGVHFTPLSQQQYVVDTQYVDEYGNYVDPSLITSEVLSKEGGYILIDEAGNEFMYNTNVCEYGEPQGEVSYH